MEGTERMRMGSERMKKRSERMWMASERMHLFVAATTKTCFLPSSPSISVSIWLTTRSVA